MLNTQEPMMVVRERAKSNPAVPPSPGPWEAVDEGDQFTIFAQGRRRIITVVGTEEFDRNVAHSNALLMAAAPELAAALRRVMYSGTQEAMAEGYHALVKAGHPAIALDVRRQRKNPHQPEVEALLKEQGFTSHGYTRQGEVFYHPQYPAVSVIVGWGPGQNPGYANPRTPGPWAVQGRNIHHLQFEEPLDARNLIASVPSESPEALANAHFIAAAPNLLAASKKALDFIHSLPYEPSSHPSTAAQDALVDAIANAEGN